MHSSLLVLAAFSSAAASSAAAVEKAFEEFVTTYGKVYDSHEERESRFQVFANNFALVEAENAKSQSFQLAINSFSDMPLEEFRGQRLGYSPPAHSFKLLRAAAPFLGTDFYSGGELPESVDWFKDGAVTPIKDQGSCGSCWTFSTSGALEGAWQIATGDLVSISEQQLIDCAKDGGVDGCNGGEMDPAFTYLEAQNVCSEESYPYQKQAGDCVQEQCSAAIPKGGVVGFKDVPAGDTKALMEAVAQQPVSTAVQAGQSAFQMYKSGVLTADCTANVDHAVLLVGYGTDNGVDYWKIKNSWGSSWGEEGFIRLQRGLEGNGECGVKVMPSYPVVRAPEAVV